MKLALAQIEGHGEFLKTDDPGLLAAQAFVGSFFPLVGHEGLKFLPCPGTYMDQPAELMEILGRLQRAISLAQRTE